MGVIIMNKYKDEYLNLINDDQDFANIWQDNDQDFKEWCEVHNIKINDDSSQKQ